MDRPNSNPARASVRNVIASELGGSSRAETRVWTILRVAKISFADRQTLCRVRNISPHGLMAEASTRLACGGRLSIELRDGLALTGTVMWQEGGRTGIELDERIDVAQVLHPRPAARNDGPRAPRLVVHGSAVIRTQHGVSRVALRDISQRGAKFDHDVQFAAGLPIKIMIDGYRELQGFVRWSREGQAGVEFADCIPYEELGGEIYTRWTELALAGSTADG